MWDYDKLFAKGNVIGIKNEATKEFGVYQITRNKELPRDAQYFQYGRYWDDFANTLLARSDIFIQYIIRLDEHGNVIEKLFDRDKDIPKPMPKLEDGMFGKIGTFDWDEYGNIEYLDIEDFIITNNKVLFIRNGEIDSWGIIEDLVDSTLDKDALCDEDKLTPIEIYKNVKYLKNDMDTFEVIWRHPEYQKYLDSKSN